MEKILVVAYHFPPVGGLGAAGSQRMHKITKYLPTFELEPVVLTVKEGSYESYLKIDPTLLADVSPNLAVIRTGVIRLLTPLLRAKNMVFGARGDASENSTTQTDGVRGTTRTEHRSLYQGLKDNFTDLFEIPDEVAGWLLPAVWSGRRAIRETGVQAILATGRPWTTLVVGAVLKKLTGKPLIVDFRDPWMTNPFRVESSGLKERLELKLERWVIASADLIVANTDELRQEFLDRFGSTVRDKCVTILNGFDDSEFAKVRAAAIRAPKVKKFALVHAGFLYGKRDPKALIDAISLLLKNDVISSRNFNCNLIGSVELTYDLGRYVHDQGLDSIVTLAGERSYAESISTLATCDLALLLQPGTTTQIPSKVFEYIGLGRRFITIASSESSVAILVKSNGLGCVADPASVTDIANVIQLEFKNWQSNGSNADIDPAIMAKFDVKSSVSALSGEIKRIIARQPDS